MVRQLVHKKIQERRYVEPLFGLTKSANIDEITPHMLTLTQLFHIV